MTTALFDHRAYPPGTLKALAGFSSAGLSHISGCPLDQFRVLVAQDLAATRTLPNHLCHTFRNLRGAFVGGAARVTMKTAVATSNISVPKEIRAEHPFLVSFAIGFFGSPLFNVPRILQLSRIAGQTYPQAFKSLFKTRSGLREYARNTLMFAPGEGLRMMLCFGSKDFLSGMVGGNTDASKVGSVALHTAKMSAIMSPMAALVETVPAVAGETASAMHAGILSGKIPADASFWCFVKKTVTPMYMARCFFSLFLKNTFANFPLFWVMSATDFVTSSN
eukprot:NODE_12084_length_1247_cov_3.486607.p1 GENE.NODE_12084_length_1247_cov_3.486607~~NODE_12084_length_1247_cov_3.486607.p1  ORF type:complete len:278 (-),score=58.83 NODE_12084_length_1247_cov_3.486607:297-1130(-)